jgi:hypothetical protein
VLIGLLGLAHCEEVVIRTPRPGVYRMNIKED